MKIGSEAALQTALAALRARIVQPAQAQWRLQVVTEIDQGRCTALAYLLSPVQKVVSEAGRER